MSERPFSVAFIFGVLVIAVSFFAGFVHVPTYNTLHVGMHVLAVIVCIVLYYSEYLGKAQLSYSKFSSEYSKQAGNLNARLGFSLIYAMPFITYTVLWYIYGKPSSQFHLIALATYSGHFIKRILECLFLHKYSKNVEVLSVVEIGSFYTFGAVIQHYWCNIYTSPYLAEQLINNQSLLIVGLTLYAVGEFINFYHHFLLAQLRPKGASSGKYSVPSGGLFELLVCPHYFGELVGWLGMSILSQHSGIYLSWLTMVTYLAGRSHQTREWYITKMDSFPKDRRNLFPAIY